MLTLEDVDVLVDTAVADDVFVANAVFEDVADNDGVPDAVVDDDTVAVEVPVATVVVVAVDDWVPVTVAVIIAVLVAVLVNVTLPVELGEAPSERLAAPVWLDVRGAGPPMPLQSAHWGPAVGPPTPSEPGMAASPSARPQ